MKRIVPVSRIARFLTFLFVFSAGVLSIVATGGSNHSTTTVACTGPGQNVRTGSAVILDARCSDFTDAASDTDTMEYFWQVKEKPAGSSVGLSSFFVITQFIADVDGEYLVELSTTTPGATASKTTVLIVATTGNARPRVEAGAYQEVAIGDSVMLNASGSDADENGLSYSWTFHPSSETETLTSSDSQATGFIASQQTDYLVDVTANDGVVDSPTDSVLVRSKDPNFSLPVAIAGPDQYVTVGTPITLDGLASYSAYDRPLSYQWRMLSRARYSTASLFGADSAQPQFLADREGFYVIRLRVKDGINDSNRSIDGVFEDRVVVYASDNRLPTADGGSDQSVNTGATVNLDGSGSSDPEMATLSYDWSIFKQPAGSTATLSSSDTMTTSFSPDMDGDYLLRLVVNDGVDDSLPDIVRVSSSSLIGGATALTVTTSLPYAPPGDELSTRILIDNDGSDALAIDSTADMQPANFDIAMMMNANGSSDADFVPYSGWNIVSPASLTIADTATPTFVMQRTSDGQYYQLIVDFTVLANFTVQIDSPLQAWRCGSSAADCP